MLPPPIAEPAEKYLETIAQASSLGMELHAHLQSAQARKGRTVLPESLADLLAEAEESTLKLCGGLILGAPRVSRELSVAGSRLLHGSAVIREDEGLAAPSLWTVAALAAVLDLESRASIWTALARSAPPPTGFDVHLLSSLARGSELRRVAGLDLEAPMRELVDAAVVWGQLLGGRLPETGFPESELSREVLETPILRGARRASMRTCELPKELPSLPRCLQWARHPVPAGLVAMACELVDRWRRHSPGPVPKQLGEQLVELSQESRDPSLRKWAIDLVQKAQTSSTVAKGGKQVYGS